jgi:hypothetical protein
VFRLPGAAPDRVGDRRRPIAPDRQKAAGSVSAAGPRSKRRWPRLRPPPRRRKGRRHEPSTDRVAGCQEAGAHEEKTRQALAELDGPAASTTPGGQVLEEHITGDRPRVLRRAVGSVPVDPAHYARWHEIASAVAALTESERAFRCREGEDGGAGSTNPVLPPRQLQICISPDATWHRARGLKWHPFRPVARLPRSARRRSRRTLSRLPGGDVRLSFGRIIPKG